MTEALNVDRAVFAFAGLVVITGVLFGMLLSPWWFVLDVLAGVNMFQAAFTGWCPAAMVFKKMGLAPGTAFS